MKKRLFVLTMPCILALCLHAAGVPVLRFVPVAGTESDVPMSSLQKVVFTQDSIVLVSATDGEETPMYKYDYQSILFINDDPGTVLDLTQQQLQGTKFIRDGQLFIRHGNQVYNIYGHTIQ